MIEQICRDYSALTEVLGALTHEIMDFHNGLAKRDVVAHYPRSNATEPLVEDGKGAIDALAAFRAKIAPYLSGSVGPRYLGYVTGGSTPAALMGDWLASAVDQNVGMPGDSIATHISLEALGWLLDLFRLPRTHFEGVFTTGATASNLLALLSAREWSAAVKNRSAAEDGLLNVPALQVFGACPHASFIKVMGIAGLGRSTIHRVATLPDREAIDPDDLERELAAERDSLKMVVASAGTVTTTDFDDFPRIAEICHRHGAWLHVDAAFGIFARCWPERAGLAEGLEHADSITGDAHKWLNVPYDCGFFFTRRMDLLERACGVSASYLKTGSDEPEFLLRGIESSQRFRGLPVWMTLKAYGSRGAADIVASCCRNAAALGRWVVSSPDYELLAPVRLNVVCFRGLPSGPHSEADVAKFNQVLLEQLNAAGKVRLTPGQYGGRSGLRAAFCNWMTEENDIEVIEDALQRTAADLR